MIGIIGALLPEIKEINSLIESPEKKTVGSIEFTVGKIGKTDVVSAVCGMGKVFASACAEAMAIGFSPDLIINVGAAGTLTPKLHIGELAVANRVLQHDMDNSPLGFRKGEIAELKKIYFDCDKNACELFDECATELGINHIVATIATGDLFVESPEKKKQLAQDFGADVAAMEGAAIAQVCEINNIPFEELRAISDEAGENASANFAEFLPKVIGDAVKLIERFIEKSEIAK